MNAVIEAPEISKFLNKSHINKWAAFSSDYKKLLAVGETLSDVLKKTGKTEVAVMQIPPASGYAPITK